MRRNCDSPWAAMFVGGLLAIGIYGGAYAVTVQKLRPFCGLAMDAGNTNMHWIPTYRGNNELLSRVFAPAHEIDRKLRPRYWNVPRIEDLRGPIPMETSPVEDVQGRASAVSANSRVPGSVTGESRRLGRP